MPLPQPDRAILSSAPLVAVLLQVRFESRDVLATPESGAALLGHLAPAGFSQIMQMQQQQFIVGTGVAPGPQAEAQPAGWQFSTSDGSSRVGVLANEMSLETQAYIDWPRFSANWATCLTALVEVASPSLVTRLGLRYVNRITAPEVATAAELAGSSLVEPPFLGPAVGSALSEFVQATEGRVTLDLPGGVTGLVQHGVVPEGGGLTFVLDIDVFEADASPFSLDGVREGSRRLNDRALQIFQSVVGPGRFRQELKPEGAS